MNANDIDTVFQHTTYVPDASNARGYNTYIREYHEPIFRIIFLLVNQNMRSQMCVCQRLPSLLLEAPRSQEPLSRHDGRGRTDAASRARGVIVQLEAKRIPQPWRCPR